MNYMDEKLGSCFCPAASVSFLNFASDPLEHFTRDVFFLTKDISDENIIQFIYFF